MSRVTFRNARDLKLVGDLTTAAGQASLGGSLETEATVKVYGIPQVDGHIQASVVFYYTGTMPL